MNSRCFWRRATSAAAFAFGLFAAAPAGFSSEDPGAFIGHLGAQAIAVLAPGTPQEQRADAFSKLFQEDFDVRGIGRFALGRYWSSATPQQQQQFLSLFERFTVQVYSIRLGDYGGVAFRVTGSRPNGDETIVRSEIRRADGRTIRLDWHLADRGGQYKVTDIDADGLSLKVAEREQFASWIDKNDGRLDALFAVLRQQVAPDR
jgi:phospholipid transport system substrate-binding protein